MRKLSIILASLFAVLGIIFTALPTEKYGLICGGIAILFSLIALKKSETNQKQFPKIIMVVSALIIAAAACFLLFTKSDVVKVDKQFEQKKIESKKEDVKELEGLE